MKWFDKQKKIHQEKLEEHSNDDNDYLIEKEFSPTNNNDDMTHVDSEIEDMETIAEEFKTPIEESDPTIEETSVTVDNPLENIETVAFFKKSITTTLSEETQLLGDIEMDGHLNVYGTIVGNITCSGNLGLYGKVEGNINCANVMMEDATIVGNIACKQHMTIKGSTQIKGNIISNDVINEGNIVGDITTHGDLMIARTAHITGDISTFSLETQRGAVIQGQITITAE